MAEIRCPHCGEVFQVDETEYAQIVRQVRDAEFQRELAERGRLAERERASAVEAAVAQARQEAQRAAAEKDAQLAELRADGRESRVVRLVVGGERRVQGRRLLLELLHPTLHGPELLLRRMRLGPRQRRGARGCASS